MSRWMRALLVLGTVLVAVNGWLSSGSPTTGTRPAHELVESGRSVSGGQPPEVYYHTGDHYRTFERLEVPQ